jgi:glutathione S-transferase
MISRVTPAHTEATMDLYFFPNACSAACRIAFMEVGVEPRYRQVDLLGKRLLDDDSDFRAVSATGRVPALVLDDGQTLTEMSAVLQYIADLDPSAGLAPPAGDPARYRLQQWLSFVGTEIHKGFLYPTFRLQGAPDGVRAFARELVDPTLAVAAARLGEVPHLAGERFTVADAYLTWALQLVRFSGVDLARWPSLADYDDRMKRRPAVREALAIERRLWGRVGSPAPDPGRG